MEFASLDDAIAKGTVEDVLRMLKDGADPNAIGCILTGSTVTHTAVERGDIEILRALINAGADVTKPDFDTRTTPMDTAVAREDTAMIELLQQAIDKKQD